MVIFFIEQAHVLLNYKLHYMLLRKLLENFSRGIATKTPIKVPTEPLKPPVVFIKLSLKLKMVIVLNV